MPTRFKQQALDYHANPKPGKIATEITKPCDTQLDLSLAYTPGVAEPCRAIHRDEETAYDYTAKGNRVAVITDGTAVLGLGNIGALAGKPVMEGKGVLFKAFAGIDVFDIEVKADSTEDFIKTVKNIAPTFGGINLEDIAAPACFDIEQALIEQLDIPVFHDDQHGTAIIISAALLNALELQHKKIEDVRVVCLGAGAAGIASMKLLQGLGADPEKLFMIDRNGIIQSERNDLNKYKKPSLCIRINAHWPMQWIVLTSSLVYQALTYCPLTCLLAWRLIPWYLHYQTQIRRSCLNWHT